MQNHFSCIIVAWIASIEHEGIIPGIFLRDRLIIGTRLELMPEKDEGRVWNDKRLAHVTRSSI
jgi:hypothetical protein